jgi:branched-chain amino acid transport system substrate-binding protein
MRKKIEIGTLFSLKGSYARLGRACRSGALSAIEAVNSDARFPFELVAVERDPGGEVDLYRPMCGEILRGTSARHIVGCVTSWSRKEVIPELEKAGGTLWYPCPYEGFEASEHVVYTHACPNQHLVPLLNWAFPRFGRRGYLVGSNYIWGWEIGRVARNLILSAGGEVVAERHLPIGEEGVERLIAEIRAAQPDFVLNSLIGPSSYAFLQAFEALGREDVRFGPATCPVLSCNLTECELGAIGTAAEGLISAGPWFRDPSEADSFRSSFEAAAHGAVLTLAARLREATGAADLGMPGALTIDPRTRHATLPVVIAQVRGGVFRELERREDVVADPYLTHVPPLRAAKRPLLAVVS